MHPTEGALGAAYGAVCRYLPLYLVCRSGRCGNPRRVGLCAVRRRGNVSHVAVVFKSEIGLGNKPLHFREGWFIRLAQFCQLASARFYRCNQHLGRQVPRREFDIPRRIGYKILILVSRPIQSRLMGSFCIWASVVVVHAGRNSNPVEKPKRIVGRYGGDTDRK